MESKEMDLIQLVDNLPTVKIDEEKLPQVFTEHVHSLETVKAKFAAAEEKEQQARDRVAICLMDADDLIRSAKGLGGNKAEKKKFLKKEYTSKREEIDAIKRNLSEMIDHDEYSAVAQKKLAEVQSALLDSQTAVLKVQKAQMEYQKQITEATKFVFGLSAYNLASSQSVLVKLKAILEGKSDAEIGELAEQQLNYALDQLKNQENIIRRISEADDKIKALNVQIGIKQEEIEKKDREQSKQISINAQALAKHEEILKEQQEKDEEFARMFADQDIEDSKQDEKISENAERINKVEENIEVNKADIQKNLDKIKALSEEIEEMKNTAAVAGEKIKKAKIIGLVSGGIGAASLILGALIAFGVI